MLRRELALLLLVGLPWICAAESGSTGQAAIGLYAGPSLCAPITGAENDPTLAHFGWGLGGGAELSIGRIRVLSLGADLLFIGASAVSPEGVLYRAWNGLRLSLAAGYEFPIRSLSLGVTAGGALTAAEYRGTSLIFAYPSILARAELSLPIARGSQIRIGLPIEVMLRGAYTDFSPGLSAAFAYGFALGASKR